MGILAGKSALVTGGRQGIGRGIADRFAEEGARVILTGRGSRPADLPSHFDWRESDVSDAAAVDRLAADIDALDILVNNAGVQIEKTVTETTDKDWDLLIGANAKGVFLMCRALIPRMAAGGSIINIGSISGQTADPGLALYNASKAFVHGLTRSIAVDHGPHIRCNAICPGWIMTAWRTPLSTLLLIRTGRNLMRLPATLPAASASRRYRGHGRWLASDQSAFTTGQCFTVDGGLTTASPLNPGLF